MLTKKIVMVGAVIALLASGSAWAKVPSAEAERLKKELTPLGAERSGSADGSIPAWEGGMTEVPAGLGYRGPGDFHPDPLKDDKKLFSITGKNVDQYADKLSTGMLAMLKRYPDMRMDVYPTRRTASAPQEVYDATLKCATTVELSEDKQTIIHNGAKSGIPFPIPQNGHEVMFNHNLRWRGTGMEGEIVMLNVQKNGSINEGSGGNTHEKYPWYDPNEKDDIYYEILLQYSRPARRKGEIVLLIDPLDMANEPRLGWQYLPGQRRVRRAPSIAYDTPNPSHSGLAVYDEVFVFNGALDRYDWKIVGKKEMYIPYNNYAFDLASQKELLTPKFPNPDFMRWELHRVWEVEATLKDDKRHCYGKRTFYLDEDTWVAVAHDAYDNKGNLWRTSLGTTKNAYELPGVVSRTYIGFDLTRDNYYVGNAVNDLPSHLIFDSTVEQKFYTPENVRRLGRR